jgi:16S rRNA processing protein RimM
VLEIREMKNVVVIRFRGINDRNAAEALNGLELYIDRDNLPDDELEEDEFFYADLEGLEALDDQGVSYGTVTGVFDFGAGDLLELKGPASARCSSPFPRPRCWRSTSKPARSPSTRAPPASIDDPDEGPSFTPDKPKKNK